MERWCVEWGPGFRILVDDQATVEELWRFCALRDDAVSVLRITRGGNDDHVGGEVRGEDVAGFLVRLLEHADPQDRA